MELVIAAHDLHPDPESGGTGRYVHEIGCRLVKRGHSVTVLTRRRGGMPPHERVAGMRVRRVPFRIVGRTAPRILADLPRAYRDVRRFMADCNPDLVSFQGPLVGTLVDQALPDALPRSCTFHSPWPDEYRLAGRDGMHPVRERLNRAVRWFVDRQVVTNSTQVITLSRWMRERLRARYDPARSVEVVPGGVDVGRFRPDGDTYGPIERADRAVLAVRRLAPRTGIDLLLRAFARAQQSSPDVQLFIAGDGPWAGTYRDLAGNLGIGEETTFLGYVPDTDLPAAYACADLVAMPSRALEGFGLSTLEALASGTPVVGTPVGGNRELLGACTRAIDPPAPMLTKTTSAGAMARAMAKWLAAPTTEAGRRCRQFVLERYDWSHITDEILDRYRQLLEHDRLARRGRITGASGVLKRVGRRSVDPGRVPGVRRP